MSYILKPSSGSIKNSKRIGRGNGSGQGRTAGKGHKGYKSRSGASNKFHFEGGQTPLARRIPKRGMGTGKFNHLQTKSSIQIVNLSIIDKYFSSLNGKDFAFLGTINTTFSDSVEGSHIDDYTINLNDTKAQFIKLKAKNYGVCPDWHLGAGGKTWLFVDEIIIQ